MHGNLDAPELERANEKNEKENSTVAMLLNEPN
jgi:hypothetical protein